MTPILMTGPALELVTLAECNAWMRVDASADDDLISALITSARLIVEAATRTFMISQNWRITYDAWPAGQMLAIPLAPLRSLDVLRTFDAAGAPAPVLASTYVLDNAPMAARLKFRTAPEAPGQLIAGIEMQVTVGYGTSGSDVPRPLRQAILMLATRWYDNRGDAAKDAAALPAEISKLISPCRRARLA